MVATKFIITKEGNISGLKGRRSFGGKVILQLKRQLYKHEVCYSPTGQPKWIPTGDTQWRDVNGNNLSEITEVTNYLNNIVFTNTTPDE